MRVDRDERLTGRPAFVGDHILAVLAIAAAEQGSAVESSTSAETLSSDALIETVDDPAYRKTFLENVHENARLLERARAWLDEPAATPA